MERIEDASIGDEILRNWRLRRIQAMSPDQAPPPPPSAPAETAATRGRRTTLVRDTAAWLDRQPGRRELQSNPARAAGVRPLGAIRCGHSGSHHSPMNSELTGRRLSFSSIWPSESQCAAARPPNGARTPASLSLGLGLGHCHWRRGAARLAGFTKPACSGGCRRRTERDQKRMERWHATWCAFRGGATGRQPAGHDKRKRRSEACARPAGRPVPSAGGGHAEKTAAAGRVMGRNASSRRFVFALDKCSPSLSFGRALSATVPWWHVRVEIFCLARISRVIDFT